MCISDRQGVKECEAKVRQERDQTVDPALHRDGVWMQKQREEARKPTGTTHTNTLSSVQNH